MDRKYSEEVEVKAGNVKVLRRYRLFMVPGNFVLLLDRCNFYVTSNVRYVIDWVEQSKTARRGKENGSFYPLGIRRNHFGQKSQTEVFILWFPSLKFK